MMMEMMKCAVMNEIDDEERKCGRDNSKADDGIQAATADKSSANSTTAYLGGGRKGGKLKFE